MTTFLNGVEQLRGITTVGNLVILPLGEKVAMGYDPTTGENGFLVKYKNGTGGNSVKGTVVSTSAAVDNSFILQTNEFDSVGVVAVAGVANGSDCWLWRHGSVCQVLFQDSIDATRGYVAICSATDGRATCIAVPSASPAAAEHFKEIGHVAEQKAGGVNVLALIHLHTL